MNDNDQYFEILNTTVFPRTRDAQTEEGPLKIMWFGPEQEAGRDWRTHHFVPLLTRKQQPTITVPTDSMDHLINIRDSRTKQKANPETIERHVNKTYEEIEVDDDNQGQVLAVQIDSRQIFPNASVIINEILNAIKENHVEDILPQQVIYLSNFIVKGTCENRLSIGKDGNGAWIQNSSSETTFVLTTKGNYQIVRRNAKGQFHYHERAGRQYV